MFELFKRFIFDPDFATARVRALLFAIGTLFSQGILTLDVLSEKLGPFGWWVGVGLMVIAVAIRAGDPTPPAAKALASADPVLLKSQLQGLGVPHAVAQEAAVKTAAETPAKV